MYTNQSYNLNVNNMFQLTSGNNGYEIFLSWAAGERKDEPVHTHTMHCSCKMLHTTLATS